MLAVTTAWLLKCWLQIWKFCSVGCRFYMFAFPTKCTKFSLCGSPRAGVEDYVNVTWSTDENCVEPVGHMLITCWSHVGHMLLCLLVCPLCTPGEIVHQDNLSMCSRETMFPLMFILCRHIVHISTS